MSQHLLVIHCDDGGDGGDGGDADDGSVFDASVALLMHMEV